MDKLKQWISENSLIAFIAGMGILIFFVFPKLFGKGIIASSARLRALRKARAAKRRKRRGRKK
jgi:hypothetical protein